MYVRLSDNPVCSDYATNKADATLMKLSKVHLPVMQEEMLRYLHNHQNKDGGFGLHIEGHSTMFGTVLRCACLPDCHNLLLK